MQGRSEREAQERVAWGNALRLTLYYSGSGTIYAMICAPKQPGNYPMVVYNRPSALRQWSYDDAK
jgi:hypothetical protein